MRRQVYRGTSLMRSCGPLGPYGRPLPRDLWYLRKGRFLMSEVALYAPGFRVKGFESRA